MTARCVPGESGEQQRASPMARGLVHRDMRSCNVDGWFCVFMLFLHALALDLFLFPRGKVLAGLLRSGAGMLNISLNPSNPRYSLMR